MRAKEEVKAVKLQCRRGFEFIVGPNQLGIKIVVRHICSLSDSGMILKKRHSLGMPSA
tara:strand:- start:173 stop:346 length:174 start_codon:yes stop_codon:yes gene_type:complete